MKQSRHLLRNKINKVSTLHQIQQNLHLLKVHWLIQLMVLFVNRNCKYLIWSDLSKIGRRVRNEMEFHFWKLQVFGRTNLSVEKKKFGPKLVLTNGKRLVLTKVCFVGRKKLEVLFWKTVSIHTYKNLVYTYFCIF